MRYKILTVDDSKTVRIIVRKAFKAYDCEILEASNGAEGLAIAAKETPHLILLDVTMPIMDGVEMLTKLKADPALRAIPVMMLTAEGGRDHVLRIAKIGVRDYLVKPFKEEILIGKARRILDLQINAAAPAKAKSILDSATILVVEDKPVIIEQIQEGLKHTPWKIYGVTEQAEAMDFASRTPTDAIIVSLSLPEESAFTLFRQLRNGAPTKNTPVFALVVKTETSQQQQAQTVGFTGIVTKPIDFAELEAKLSKAMNLDTSQRYYAIEEGNLIMRLPENCSLPVLAESANYLKPKFAEAVDGGISRVVIDLHRLKSLDISVIKLLVQAMQNCHDLGMKFVLFGNPAITAECKGFEETRGWIFCDSLAAAKASLAGAAAPQLAGV